MTDSRIIDLHTHSTYSDGSMSPRELAEHAALSGISAIALSDHDSADGIAEAAAAAEGFGIELIPAIELSCISECGEVHILGYFIDPESPHLRSAVGYIREVRRTRITETCEMLQKCGIAIPFEEVEARAGHGILCRAHIAKLMTEKGYTSSPREAFEKWMNFGRPAYSDAQAITPAEAVEIIQKSGGDAYLAHLHLTKRSGEALEAFVRELRDCGLCGIEGFYTDYTPRMQAEYRTVAARLGLKLSGGTDFHGEFKPHISIGRGLGELEIPYSVLDNMRK